MPTVNLDRTEFFKRLGKEYGKWILLFLYNRHVLHLHKVDPNLFALFIAFKDFDELLFEYGLELDEDVRIYFALKGF